ncbi:MAG: hypothetical protein FWB85_05385 [Chitinispirillia bacterium]|nr:hypothetical protein [Chitinispirillia bacterium]MCL2241658.1 hypothetical protein [Chitinispirillia bacterium]
MKLKILICAAAAMVMCLSGPASAFISPNALGVVLGTSTEINYQKAMGAARLEIGVGWDINASSLNGGVRYHVLHRNISDGLHWYLGPGAGLYVHDGDNDNVHLYAGLPIGIEYNFNKQGVPLLLSLDLSPGIQVFPKITEAWSIGLGIRWTF